eukprot:Gb_14657 [translate_table: standard]
MQPSKCVVVSHVLSTWQISFLPESELAFPIKPGGRILEFIYGGKQFHTKGGLVAGTATTNYFRSEHFKHKQRSTKAFTCSPEEVILGSDSQQSMYCHLLCGLLYSNEVEFVSSTFAYSIVEAFRMLEQVWEELCNDIKEGTLSQRITIPSMREAMSKILVSNPELAEAIREKTSKLENWHGVIEQLWPNAKYVYSIMTGAMEPYLKKLRHYAGSLPLLSADYGATECWIGVNLNPRCPPQTTTFTVVPNFAFFEFIPLTRHVEDWQVDGTIAISHSRELQPVGLTEVKVDQEYEVVLTTFAEFVSSTFAYSIVEAFRMLEQVWEELCNDIKEGTLSQRITIPSMREAMSKILVSNPELAEAIREKTSKLENWHGVIEQLWPNAKYVYSIMTGAMEPYLKKLRHYAGSLPLLSADYGATEGWIGVNLNPRCPPQTTTFTVVPNFAFFEFIPLTRHVEDWQVDGTIAISHSRELQPVGLTEVKVDQEYEVVLTTFAGMGWKIANLKRTEPVWKLVPAAASVKQRLELHRPKRGLDERDHMKAPHFYVIVLSDHLDEWESESAPHKYRHINAVITVVAFALAIPIQGITILPLSVLPMPLLKFTANYCLLAYSECPKGDNYHLLGLYRYKLGDVVKVTGFYNSSPQLAFVCRKNHLLTVNIDKNTEKDLQMVVDKASQPLKEERVELVDYTSYVDCSTEPGHYVIFWELSGGVNGEVLKKCCLIIDQSFIDPGYVSSRKMKTIGPLELRIVDRGLFQKILNHYLTLGATVSQFKTPRCIRSNQVVLDILNSGVIQKYFSAAFP